jgi:hypothetical protein
VGQLGKYYTPGVQSTKLPRAAMQLMNEMLSGSFQLLLGKIGQWVGGDPFP